MKPLFAFVLAILIPTVCFALATSEVGNKPLSKANYTDWPGLVDAVNDDSRVYQVWVNGGETFSYAGDTASANRVLKEFAETKVPKLELVILPGPGSNVTIEKKPVTIDYRIEVAGGITRAALLRGGLSKVQNIHPTMTIYITENIDLQKLAIPSGLVISQLSDVESRYETALEDDDPRVRQHAEIWMKALNKEFRRQGEKFKLLEKQITEIETFVAQHQKNSVSE